MEFYTTAQQESRLTEEYEAAVRIKQSELDKEPGRMKKYTAKAYISRPERVFWVQEGKVYFESISEENALKPEFKNVKYEFDPDFKMQIKQFQESHPVFKIRFLPDGKWGPTIDYCCKNIKAMPAILEAPNGDVLVAENEDHYSPNCC